MNRKSALVRRSFFFRQAGMKKFHDLILGVVKNLIQTFLNF